MIRCINLDYAVVNKKLLDRLSLNLEEGKVHAILGPNGAGKTTLLQCLTKDLPIGQGQVFWQNKDLNCWSLGEMAQTRAVLAQLLELNFAFSVRQIIELGLEQNPTLMQNDYSRVVAQLAEIFDLAALMEQNYLTLSGGEKQRAQFARVLAQIYRLDQNYQGLWLLLDEWNNGLDLKHQQRIACYLSKWRQQGMGVIMVAHDLNLVLQLADECYLLKEGRLVTSGQPKAVLSQKTIEQVFEVKIESLQQGEQIWIQLFQSV